MCYSEIRINNKFYNFFCIANGEKQQICEAKTNNDRETSEPKDQVPLKNKK